MLTLRFGCAFCLACAGSVAQVAAQAYQQQAQGYEQQQQYPEQQYQQQYPQQQPGAEQQQPPPPGYFPTPDAQGSYGYQQQYQPNAAYPQQGYAGQPAVVEEPLVSSVQGAFQISAGISLLQYNSLSISQTSMNPPAVVPPMAAPGAPPPAAAPTPQQYLYGKTDRHPLNLELGYGVTKNILVGALVQWAGSSETLEANGGKAPVSDSMFTFAPKFDYHFSPTSRLNPFLGGVVGVSLHSKKSGPYKDSRTLFGLGLRGGVRFFVLDQLSLDPSATLGFNFGSGTQKQEGVQPVEFEDSLSGPYFVLAMGVSVYIK